VAVSVYVSDEWGRPGGKERSLTIHEWWWEIGSGFGVQSFVLEWEMAILVEGGIDGVHPDETEAVVGALVVHREQNSERGHKQDGHVLLLHLCAPFTSNLEIKKENAAEKIKTINSNTQRKMSGAVQISQTTERTLPKSDYPVMEVDLMARRSGEKVRG
jgi:hypothetical protein